MQRCYNGEVNGEMRVRSAPPFLRVPEWLARAGWGLLAFVQVVLAFSPLLAVLALYALSWRGAALIGHWPLPMADDPKFIGQGDTLYAVMYMALCLLFALSCYGLPILIALTAMLSYRHAKLWPVLMILLYFASLVLFSLLESAGDRMTWFMD